MPSLVAISYATERYEDELAPATGTATTTTTTTSLPSSFPSTNVTMHIPSTLVINPDPIIPGNKKGTKRQMEGEDLLASKGQKRDSQPIGAKTTTATNGKSSLPKSASSMNSFDVFDYFIGNRIENKSRQKSQAASTTTTTTPFQVYTSSSGVNVSSFSLELAEPQIKEKIPRKQKTSVSNWSKNKQNWVRELTAAGWSVNRIGKEINIIAKEGDIKIPQSTITMQLKNMGLHSNFHGKDTLLELLQMNRIKELRMLNGMTAEIVAQEVNAKKTVVERYMSVLDEIYGVPEWRKEDALAQAIGSKTITTTTTTSLPSSFPSTNVKTVAVLPSNSFNNPPPVTWLYPKQGIKRKRLEENPEDLLASKRQKPDSPQGDEIVDEDDVALATGTATTTTTPFQVHTSSSEVNVSSFSLELAEPQIKEKIPRKQKTSVSSWSKNKQNWVRELTAAGWSANKIGKEINIIAKEGDTEVPETTIRSLWKRMGLYSKGKASCYNPKEGSLKLPQMNRIKQLRMLNGMTAEIVAQEVNANQTIVEHYMNVLDEIYGVPEWCKEANKQ